MSQLARGQYKSVRRRCDFKITKTQFYQINSQETIKRVNNSE